MEQIRFPLDESGAEISVVQYFRQKYNYVIKYPLLPALQAGSTARPIYLPMEVSCLISHMFFCLVLSIGSCFL